MQENFKEENCILFMIFVETFDVTIEIFHKKKILA